MKRDNKEEKSKKENTVVFVFLCLVLLFYGVPRTIQLNHLFETDSVLVSATITPYRNHNGFGNYGHTCPAFKGSFIFENTVYTAFVVQNITESEYKMFSEGDTVVLRILKSNPKRARWEKTYGIRHSSPANR